MKKFALLMLLAGCGSSGSSPDASTTAPDAPAADLGPDLASDATSADASADTAALADADERPGKMKVSWTLSEIDSTMAVSCAEADTPTLVLSATRDADAGSLPAYRFPLPCPAMLATTDPMAPGRYHVSLTLQDRQGAAMSAVEGDFTVPPGSETDLGVIIFPVQRFELQWSIQKGGQPSTCAAAGAETVELASALGGKETIYPFPCAAGQGRSAAIALGKYALQVRLKAAAGMVLWQSDPMNVEVGDQKAVLPAVTFVLP